MRQLLRAASFVVSVATSLVLTTPREASALPCCVSAFVFYTDCTYTTPIGGTHLECNGQRQSWGTVDYNAPQRVTIYSCENESCCYNPPDGCDYVCQAEGPQYYCP